MANWFGRLWSSIWTGGNASWADISFQPRPAGLPNGMPNINVGAGPRVVNWPIDTTRMDEIYALGHPALWRCVHIVAGAIASMPMHAYRDLDRVEDPSRLLTDPSPTRTRSSVWHTMVEALLMHGNALAILGEPDRLEYPQTFRPIHPLRVWAEEVDGEILRYLYQPRSGNGNGNGNGQPPEPIELEPSEVMHIRGITIPGEPFGIGVLEAMQRSLTVADYLRDYAKSWFEGSGIPSGIIHLANPNPSQQVVDDARERWREAHGGPNREPAVLPGDVNWESVAQPPEASQLLQSRLFSHLEIALMFGVPPHMLQAQQPGPSMTYQNVEQQAIDFVKWTLLFWLEQIEETLTHYIPRGQYVKFNLDGLLRTDTLNRYRAHQIGVEGMWLSTNEVRAMEGRPPLTPEEMAAMTTPAPAPPPAEEQQSEEEEAPELEILGGGESRG